MLQAEMLKECLKQQVIKEQEDEIEASSPRIMKKFKKTECLKETNENKEDKSLVAAEVTTEVERELKICDGGLKENCSNSYNKDK